MNRKLVISAALFAITIVLLCVSSCGSEVQDINVSVNSPLHVNKSEEFVFEVEVGNTAEESQLLYSIDIWDEYMAGISIIKSEPPFIDTYHIPIDNTQSFEFKLDIAPKDKVIVKFYAVGIEVGEYSSYLDVCINTEVDFLSFPITTIVRE